MQHQTTLCQETQPPELGVSCMQLMVTYRKENMELATSLVLLLQHMAPLQLHPAAYFLFLRSC